MKDERHFVNVGADAAELQREAEQALAEEGVTDPLRIGMQKLLNQFYRYYTVNEESPLEPFFAEAEFSIHGEEFFLVKAAKYAEMDSKEFCYFYLADSLTAKDVETLCLTAWENGLSRAVIREHHRNTDVVVYIVANEIPKDAEKAIRKARYYKNYKMGLWGFSQFKLAAIEINSGKTVTNYQGKPLLKILKKLK